MVRNFREMVLKKWKEGKFFCLALNSDYDRISPGIRNFVAGIGGLTKEIIFRFNKVIIDETAGLVCAYAFNLGVYAAYAKSAGIEALLNSVEYIRKAHPDVPVILDAPLSSGDRMANKILADSVFKEFGVDALILNPLAGSMALKPLIDRNLKGIIVLCHSSEESGRELQDVPVTPSSQRLVELLNGPARSLGKDTSGFPQSIPFYQYLALRVANHWNISDNCWLCFEADGPEEIEKTRKIVDDLPFFIKSETKTDLRQLIKASLDSRKQGFIVSVPDIVFSSDQMDFRDKAVLEIQRLNKVISEARE